MGPRFGFGRAQGSRAGPLTGLLCAAVATGCLPELPTLPQASDPSDPRVRFSEPVVWVSSPAENGTIQRSALFSEQGAPVYFEGMFEPGHDLHLMAVRVQAPDLGFYIVQVPITDTVSPGPAYIQSSPAILFNTHRIRLKLRLRDPDGGVVSIDSVNVNLR